jgi:hypothetical protein
MQGKQGESMTISKEENDKWFKFWNDNDNPLKNRASKGGTLLLDKKGEKTINDIENIIYFSLHKRKSHIEIVNLLAKLKFTPDNEMTNDDIIKMVSEKDEEIHKFFHKFYKVKTVLLEEDEKNNKLLLTQNPLYKEAKEIYESGNFIGYCIKTWNKVWYHDEQIIEMILMAGANHRILNSKEGLHTFISGDTQIGKTKGGRTALKFIPPDMKVDKTFSKMWIYYAYDNGELVGRQFLFSDESRWDEETAAIYRTILTSWDEGGSRGTVMNGETKDLYIPPRVTLIATAVDTMVKKTDEGQDESRYTIVEVYHTKEEEKAIKQFLQQPPANIDKELEIIKIIWSLIPECEVNIPWIIDTIPIPKRGKIDLYTIYDPQNRELLKYMGMLKAKALLSNKRVVDKDDAEFVNSFLTHTRPMIKGNIAGMVDSEKKLYEWANIHAVNQKIPITEVCIKLDMPPSSLYNAIHGKDGTFEKSTGGLLTKCTDFNVVKNENGAYCISITKYNAITPYEIERTFTTITNEGLEKEIRPEDIREILVKIMKRLPCKNNRLSKPKLLQFQMPEEAVCEEIGVIIPQ